MSVADEPKMCVTSEKDGGDEVVMAMEYFVQSIKLGKEMNAVLSDLKQYNYEEEKAMVSIKNIACPVSL